MRSFEAYSYGCIMLPMPKKLADKMQAIGARIPDDRIYDDGSGELGREDDPHVTLKYGLHTSDAEEVAEKMKGRWPVSIGLGGLSVFDNPEFIVLKVDITGTGLRALNRYVCENFDFTDKYKDYNPHATIAYLKKDKENPEYYKEFFTDELKGESAVVGEIDFSSADGKHTMIPLEGQSPSQRVASIAERVTARVLR